MKNTNKKILIIDDDPGMRKAIQRILCRNNNYEIKEADGYTAMQEINSFMPDIVILDIKMPGKNGYEVLEDIRDIVYTKHIKVIGMSGISGRIGAAFMDILKADAYFEKPFDNAKLKTKIHELLEDGCEK